ncbi:putative 4-coumarate--CoA ligase 2 [Haemaphysalis longicornis]
MLRARIENRVVYSPHPEVSIPACSVYAYLKSYLGIQDSKIAVVDNTTRYTRQELLRAFERYAVGFQSLGLKEGDHVCAHVSNSVDSFVAVFGLILAGATVILAKESLTHRELIYQMTDGEATYVLTEPSNAKKVQEVCDEMNIPTTARFVLGEAENFISIAGFAELDEKNFREVPATDFRNTLVALIYTSGTTGMPKGVEITHHSFVANMVQSRPVTGWDETDVYLAWTPITHMSGLMFTPLAACIGSTCVIIPPCNTFLEFIEVCTKFQVTTMFSFPTRLSSLFHEMLRTQLSLDKMRKLYLSGSVVPEVITQHARDVFPNLHSFRIFFSCTECLGLITIPGPDEICFTDVGVPTPNVELKILSVTTGEPLGPHENGEIIFRTPSSLRGYYKNPKATAGFLDDDGWCHSGDVGHYDENGRLTYVERMRDLIKCMDNQVAPSKLEALIMSHCPAVAEVCVVGLPHAKYGEAAAAFVILKPGKEGSVTEQDIKDIVADNLAVHNHLFGGVYFPESLPRTGTGKVQRSALQKDAKFQTRR